MTKSKKKELREELNREKKGEKEQVRIENEQLKQEKRQLANARKQEQLFKKQERNIKTQEKYQGISTPKHEINSEISSLKGSVKGSELGSEINTETGSETYIEKDPKTLALDEINLEMRNQHPGIISTLYEIIDRNNGFTLGKVTVQIRYEINELLSKYNKRPIAKNIKNIQKAMEVFSRIFIKGKSINENQSQIVQQSSNPSFQQDSLKKDFSKSRRKK